LAINFLDAERHRSRSPLFLQSQSQVRRRKLTLTKMTDVPVGQVIGQDHNNIGLRARHRYFPLIL
jgi:hypothetical protein